MCPSMGYVNLDHPTQTNKPSKDNPRTPQATAQVSLVSAAITSPCGEVDVRSIVMADSQLARTCTPLC